MKVAFTICSNNYLSKASILISSFLKYNPDYRFYIGLADKKSEEINYDNLEILGDVYVIEIDKIGILDFEKITVKYDIIEFSTCVKPFLFEYIIAKDSATEIIYIDPDIRFYDTLQLEETGDIFLTPHILKPLELKMIPFENVFLNHGIYNLGFIKLKINSNTIDFLKWWKQRTFELGFDDLSNGYFVDQLWINLVPIFFKNVIIIFHSGMNVAYWNLSQRELSINNNKYWIDQSMPLVFFHFSSFDFTLKSISKSLSTTKMNGALLKISNEYKNELEGNEFFKFNSLNSHYINVYENARALEKRNFITSNFKNKLAYSIYRLTPKLITNLTHRISGKIKRFET